MNARKLILLIVFQFFAVSLFGQSVVYAVWEDPNTLSYNFVTLDPVTGLKTNIQVIPGMTAFVAGNKTAFSPDSNYYYVTGLIGTATHLFTIDVATGNTLYQPAITSNVVGLEYNCNDSLIYGLRESGNNYDLVRIDPVTGLITPYGGVPSISGYVGDSFTLDKVQNHYNFVALSGPGYILLSFDAATGMSVASNPFPGSATGYRYSCTDSSVFALRENNNQYLLLSIDVSNGNANTVATLSGVTPGFVAENATINSNGEYIYRGFDSNNNFALITIDLNSGSVINAVQTNDNAVGFEAGACCLDTTGSGTTGLTDIKSSNFAIHPNPATGRVYVRSDFPVESVYIYSTLGKLVFKTPSFNDETIDVSFLDPGIYLFICILKNGDVLSDRIIVE